MRASMHVKTRYFLAGGRARWPLSKKLAYFELEDSRFFWIAVDILICLEMEFEIRLV